MSAQSNDVINLDNNGDGNGYFVFICTEISLLEIYVFKLHNFVFYFVMFHSTLHCLNSIHSIYLFFYYSSYLHFIKNFVINFSHCGVHHSF